MSRALTIGRLAKAAGVNVETVRFYHRVGLLKEPPKPLYGFRNYPPEAVGQIRFIKRSQRLGFNLREIAELLKLGDGQCQDTRQIAEQKCAQIQARLADLYAIQHSLEQFIKACNSSEQDVRCPVVGALARVEPDAS